MSGLKSMLKVIPFLLILGAAYEVFERATTRNVIALILIVAAVGGGYYYALGSKRKCPSCKKLWALQKEGLPQIVSSEDTTMVRNAETKNRYGDVVGYQEQYVPGQKLTVEQVYVCKHCGEKFVETYTQKAYK